MGEKLPQPRVGPALGAMPGVQMNAQEEGRQLSLTPEPSVLFLAWMGAQNGVWEVGG